MNTQHFYQRLNSSGVGKTAQDNRRGYLLDGHDIGCENKIMLKPSAEAIKIGMMKASIFKTIISNPDI